MTPNLEGLPSERINRSPVGVTHRKVQLSLCMPWRHRRATATVISFKPQLLYPEGYVSNRKVVGIQSQSECFREQINLFPLPGIKSHIMEPILSLTQLSPTSLDRCSHSFAHSICAKTRVVCYHSSWFLSHNHNLVTTYKPEHWKGYTKLHKPP